MSVGHQLAMVEAQLESPLRSEFDQVLLKMKSALIQAFAILKNLSADPDSVASSPIPTAIDFGESQPTSSSPQDIPLAPPLNSIVERWLHTTRLASPESLQWLETPANSPLRVLPDIKAAASISRPLQLSNDQNNAKDSDENGSWSSDDGDLGGSDDEDLALTDGQEQSQEDRSSVLDSELAQLCLRINLEAYGGKTRDFAGGEDDDWETILSASGDNDTERPVDDIVEPFALDDADDADDCEP
ncbi:hypothetical protein KC323_g9006 [Hortaea werneckii]|nr:hypothetical protein KC323_g9006 [Hortaea werneckii]KAI7345228.1 hypothetical protein KC320_g8419 [Hortaea werneckii]